MTAIVMKVIHAMKHPNADALRLYKMSAPGFNNTQIVSNLENIYEEGDSAIVVLAGATLKDGTYIDEAKVRGIASYGMALGKTDLEVGTDVSDDHCRDDSVNGFRMLRWPSIESLFNIRRGMVNTGTERKVSYIAKIKLDGTNAGVQVSKDGNIVAQSRTKLITPEDDNMSFAKWVSNNQDYFSSLTCNQHMTIFGEWCGQGIQKRTAISKLDRKILAVFAIQYGGVDGEPSILDINPITINKRLRDKQEDIYVLPFYNRAEEFDFTDVDKLKKQAEDLSQVVIDVESCDPWVKQEFNIEGIGEGVVMYPLINTEVDLRGQPMLVDAFEYSDLVFKAKGEKHKVVKTKKLVQVDPEVAKSTEEFVNLFVTEARLNQIANTIEFEMKNTGTFIKELSKDVQKESVAELEASNLNWKQVSKAITTAARLWFMDKCKEL